MGWSLVQRSPTECGVSECDLETSKMTRSKPTRVAEPSNIYIYKYKSNYACLLSVSPRLIFRIFLQIKYLSRTFISQYVIFVG
jgi:hypothetical protein